VSIDKVRGLLDGLGIVGTNQRFRPNEAPIGTDAVGAIVCHRSAKGRNSPARSLETSGERNGSSPAQSVHWNLRPPVLRSKNRIGLRQVGQTGGGVFLGIGRTRWIRREDQYSQSPIIAEDGAVMRKAYERQIWLVCTVPDSKIELGHRP
jgi:hypothetical protein